MSAEVVTLAINPLLPKPVAASVVQSFMGIYRTDSQAHMTADYARAVRDPKTGKLKIGQKDYHTLRSPPTYEQYRAHLQGERLLTLIPIGQDNHVYFGAIDYDDYAKVDFLATWAKIEALGLPLIPSRSKSGGIHLWYFGPKQAAKELRRLLIEWAGELGFPKGLEIFPKQETLKEKAAREKEPVGSGINLPYFGAVDNVGLDEGGKEIDLSTFIEEATKAKENCVKDPTAKLMRVVAALKPLWVEYRRDKLTHNFSGIALNHGWTAVETKRVIKAVANCNGDEEWELRLDKVDIVEGQLRKGNAVQGIPKLRELFNDKAPDQSGTPEQRECVERLIRILAPKQQKEAAVAFSTSIVMPVGAFNTLEIPKRKALVDGLLLEETLSMVYAARGVGKTMLALDLATAVARGTEPFLKWPVMQGGARVLYVDGEMSAYELQERLKRFCGPSAPERLDILSSQHFYTEEHGSLNLANLVHQERFMGLLEALEEEGRRPQLIILDNKSALTSGTEENSNSEQDSVLEFLRALRHRGHAVVMVHHAGKNGEQRGASRNEDFLDLVIKLDIPNAKDGEQTTPSTNRGAAFRMTFTKHRGLRPDPPILDLDLMLDESGEMFTWGITEPGKKPQWLVVAEYIFDHSPVKQIEIAEGLGIQASNLSRLMTILRGDRKMVESGKSLQLTRSGRAYVEEVRRNRSQE